MEEKTAPTSPNVIAPPPKPPSAPMEPSIPRGPALIESASKRLERKAPTNRPTLEKIPPRPKAPPGGGGHKNGESNEAGAKQDGDKRQSKQSSQDKKGFDIEGAMQLKAPNDESKAKTPRMPPQREREISDLTPKVPPFPKRP